MIVRYLKLILSLAAVSCLFLGVPAFAQFESGLEAQSWILLELSFRGPNWC